MTGKIFTALTKIEAETCWSQGRLRKAMDIYTRLITTSPNMTLNTRIAIESRIKLLREELERPDPGSTDRGLESAIMKLQTAITSDESILDLRRHADEFLAGGLFADALENLKQLVRLNAGDEPCVDKMVDCLVRLHNADEVAVAVDLLLVESFTNPEKAAQFKLVLADKMNRKGFHQHADILYRHADRFSSSGL